MKESALPWTIPQLQKAYKIIKDFKKGKIGIVE